MSQSKVGQTLDKLHLIDSLLSDLKHEIASGERYQSDFASQHKIGSLSEFGIQLNARRKELGIDLYTLELQTGISASTLKRLFKDPEQVKFGSVYAVAEALGINLCAVV